MRTTMFRGGTLLLFSLAAGCLTPFVGPLHAARSDVGTSGAAFLKLNAGSRPAGMGEAFAGIAGDVHAIFYNPAGTALAETPQFAAQYGAWFQSITYNALGFIYPAAGTGTFGLGIVNLGVNDIEKRTGDTIEPDGTFGASDYAYVIHYSRKLSPAVAAGVNAKVIAQKIDTKTAASYGGDIGVLWNTPLRNLSAGLAVQNFGQAVTFDAVGDPLPLTVRTGFGYRVAVDRRSSLILGLDAAMPRDNDVLYSVGGELARSFGEDFAAALRSGYKTVAQEKLGGWSGITAGAGLTWRQFSFDFAWVPYGELGDTFRYSLVVRF